MKNPFFIWLLLLGLSLNAPAKDAVTITASPEPETAVAVPADLRPKLEQLRSRIRELTRPLALRGEPGAIPPPASATLAETWLALAAVETEKAGDYLESEIPQADKAVESLAAARTLLETKNPQAPPDLVRLGPWRELAYFSANDRSPQPYFLYVPTGYDGKTPLPLVVFLHGYDPSSNRTNPYLLSDFVADLAEQHQTLLVLPHGRTNTDFQYVGELDVLRVKAEMEQFYRVDPERIYLLGVSMGGAGVWQVGTHFPDLFAAIAPINGQADWFRFWNEMYKYPVRAELPKHIEYLFALNNPVDLAGNLLNLYSYSQHALKCFLGPGHTREMCRLLQLAGAPYTTFEDPSQLGHYIYWRKPCWERAFAQLMPKTRIKNPATVRYTTRTLRYPGANGVTITRFERWGVPATIEAVRADKGEIRVTTVNVAALELAGAWATSDGTSHITWNDRPLPDLKPDAAGRLVLTAPEPAASPAPAGKTERFVKSRAVCGPLSDVFNFPFIGVCGTAGTPEETAANQKLAKQFAKDWFNYAEGRMELVKDTDVTDAMMAQTGLILFGLPESNRILQRVADRLPFKLSREKIVLPDGKEFPNIKLGLLLTWPNPLAPDRYLVVCSGLPWGQGIGQNHKFDRLPDFSIFTADILQPIGINRYLAAGLFDNHWQYAPDLTDFGDNDQSKNK